MSFNAADTAWYELVGTKGSVCLVAAYEYTEERMLWATLGARERERSFPSVVSSRWSRAGPQVRLFTSARRP